MSQKTYPGEFLRPEVISSKSYQENVVYGLRPPPPIFYQFVSF